MPSLSPGVQRCGMCRQLADLFDDMTTLIGPRLKFAVAGVQTQPDAERLSFGAYFKKSPLLYACRACSESRGRTRSARQAASLVPLGYDLPDWLQAKRLARMTTSAA